VTATPAATLIVWQKYINNQPVTIDMNNNRYTGGTTPHTGNKLLFLYKETHHVHSTYRKQIAMLLYPYNHHSVFMFDKTNALNLHF
jgi:hypothetical protein